MQDHSLDGLIGGILSVFTARFAKKQRAEDSVDRNRAILDPFSRILSGYSTTEFKSGKVKYRFKGVIVRYDVSYAILNLLL